MLMKYCFLLSLKANSNLMPEGVTPAKIGGQMCYHRAFPFCLGLSCMLQPVVRVGEWLVTPSVNQISRKGRQLTLEPRLIDLLVFSLAIRGSA